MLQLTSFGGRGPKIYFIHGFGADAQSWIANVPAVTEIGEAVAVDLPGHGQSAAVSVPESLDAVAEQVLAAIDCSAPCSFVGHSAGGAIAMLCAASVETHAVSLISPVGLGKGISTDFVERLPVIDTEAEGQLLLQSMVVNKRLISKTLAARLLQQLKSEGLREQWQRFAALLSDCENSVITARKKIPHVPVQVFWGMHDTINPLNEADKQSFDADWHLFEQCGHLPHIEQWSAYNEFLTRLIKFRS